MGMKKKKEISLFLVMIFLFFASVNGSNINLRACATEEDITTDEQQFDLCEDEINAYAGSADGNVIVRDARTYIGKVPYVWGGNNIDGSNVGADCSGFICRLFERYGYNLWPNRTALRNCGTNLGTDLSVAQPGDILWFTGHVGIYSGIDSKGRHMVVHETGGSYQNVVETPVSWVNADLRGIIHIPGVTHNGTEHSAKLDATWSEYPEKFVVKDTAASLSKTLSVSGTSINSVSTVGIELYNFDGSKLLSSKSETPTPQNGVINMWYDVNVELGILLSPGTKYQYVFYAQLTDGTQFRSDICTITTTGTHTHKMIDNGVELAHPHRILTRCGTCGMISTGSASYNEVKIPAVAATCTKTGLTEGSKCSICEKVLVAQKTTSKLSHNKTTVNQKNATCSSEGYTGDVVCKDCGTVIQKGSSISKSEHDYTSYVSKQPTVSENGIRTYICVNCNHSYTETINKIGQPFAIYQGYSFYEDESGHITCYNSQGKLVVDEFKCDGTYTYYLQADGTAMKDRLTYHPDGVHVIYFDEYGHEVFSDFAHVKRAISGATVDDYCFFDVNGYLYVDVVTYDKEGKNLYYANPYGVLERGKWFQFSNTVMCADGTPWNGAAGNYGCANADGTLMVNTYTYDWQGRYCYMQGNGVALY